MMDSDLFGIGDAEEKIGNECQGSKILHNERMLRIYCKYATNLSSSAFVLFFAFKLIPQ